MGLNNIVGQVARGKDFFDRPKIIKSIWRKIKSGSNVLIAAPRRVGKTSIMNAIKDNPEDGFYVIYVITESARTENEYFQAIVDIIKESPVLGVLYKLKLAATDIGKKTIGSVEEIGFDSIRMKKSDEVNYKEYFKKIIKSIDLKEKKLLIMIDEYPQTIYNILNEQSEENAKHLLQINRELRQDPELSKKIQFIYTGSISLESVAKNLESTKFINDLHEITVGALSEKEANIFLDQLLENVDYNMNEEVKTYLLDRIQWLIPFHIQLLISQISDICDDKEIINEVIEDKTIIDEAFNKAIEIHIHYSTWKERLSIYKDNEYDFILDILNSISINQQLEFIQIYDISIKHNIQDRCKEIINILKNDGYIHNIENENIYMFNSPILKEWWYRNVAK